ncbi:uncharacterized protein K02A2.6-like [Macrobrachium nipponense]|uniref:uncharacterized protein K02A2.6-like n=1 Tax=Macrobrachium nipponense TaxID=159736 RepID=UPI0030C7B254
MPIDVQRLDSFSIGDDPKSVGTRWKKWIGSFQIYLEALGKINEKQQKALLLHTAGLEVQEVFNTLNLTGDSLQDAIEGLTNYFAPLANKYFERYQFIEASQESDAQERLMAQIEINGKLTPMQIDTAADVTIISERVAQTIPNLVIRPSDKVLKSYNGTNIKVVGSSQVKVQYKDQEIDYKEVFEDRVGTVKNAQAVLVLKENATPRFSAPRPVPYALKTAVETEIRRLESEGSWEKVDYSDWSTPLVPIVKENGQVRLCGDYKVTLNPQLQVAQHPLPNPKDMFATLSGCSVFSKIDLRQAFQQLSMDENSQKLCTVNTHLGLYRPKRLPYGVASSPAIWQQTMDKIFAGMSGVFIFIDDILVAGKNKKEHRERLCAVLKKLKEHNIKVNQSKCILEVDSVEYLGFIVNGKGIHKTQDKVNAVRSAKLPENVKELQSFLGLVTFYGSFIQNLATIAHPLYNLLNKDVKWNWTKECQNSFERIKAEVTSPTFLVHYQMDLPVKLVCDASNIGLGAVLAHVMPDGTEKPIAFASRVLNKAERNYSQIEKEALALVYGVKKFHMYLYGRKRFTLVTDHKPLLMILGPKASLPTLVAARLQRWAIILAAYDYNIEYRPTSKMGNADALSRLPVDKAPEQYEESILLISAYNLPITAKEIAQGTKKDPVLSKVVQSLITGRDICAEDANCKPYKEIWNELSVTQECILRGSRVVIPNALRNRVLSEIHADHQGIVRSKSIARTYVWWPGVDRDIENLVKKCYVMVRSYNTPEKWVQGEIVRKIGNLHYDVNVGGKIVKRHVDQLQSFGTNHTEVQVSNTSDLNNSDVQTAHQDVQNHATAQNTPIVLPNRMSRGKPPERFRFVNIANVLVDVSDYGTHAVQAGATSRVRRSRRLAQLPVEFGIA